MVSCIKVMDWGIGTGRGLFLMDENEAVRLHSLYP